MIKSDKPREFQYIKIENKDRRFFCLQQNPAVLAWILFFKKGTLRPIVKPDPTKPSLRLVIRWLRNNYRLFRRNLIFLVIFARYKYQLRRLDSVIELPIYGQLCVPVHKGYKIFDLRRGVVAKVFNQDVNTASILSEIEQLKKTSQIDFAPSIRRWNVAERWYEEDYVSGSLDDPYIPLDSRTVLKRFCHDLVPHINSLILSQPPITRNAVEYIHEIMEGLKVSRLSRQASSVREFNKIKSFLDSMVEHLCIEGNYPVQLVFTHGDFCPANMLNTRYGIMIIDWEGATYQSALFDFYSYFFYRSVCKKVPVDTLVSEINEALPFFISKLTRKAPDISNSLIRLEKVYRWIYYIEYVCHDVEREMTDENLNILGFILQEIETFNQYEEILSGNVDNSRLKSDTISHHSFFNVDSDSRTTSF